MLYEEKQIYCSSSLALLLARGRNLAQLCEALDSFKKIDIVMLQVILTCNSPFQIEFSIYGSHKLMEVIKVSTLRERLLTFCQYGRLSSYVC